MKGKDIYGVHVGVFKVVIADGWQWGQAPIVYKMTLMARVSNSL